MPERIYKLQPNRTLALRGFDGLGAAAALHKATANSFQVSGVFRDAADFAVLILHDSDNFYEHPRIKYLPNTDFNGLTLQFDVRYQNLRNLDSPRFATIDWPFLSVIRPDNTSARIRLSEWATPIVGAPTKASTNITIQANQIRQYDRLTVWYQNFAFDYIVPQVEASFAFTGKGEGTLHSINVADETYQIIEDLDESNTSIATRLAALVAASEYVHVSRAPANQINLRAKKEDGGSFVVSSSGGPSAVLYSIGAAVIAQNLAAQINGVNFVGLNISLPIEAEAVGNTLRVLSAKPGVDGNAITLYATARNGRLQALGGGSVGEGNSFYHLAGGSSDVTWRVTLDFAALGVPQIRLMWLTFAPQLRYAQAYETQEWDATFTNWTLTGPEEIRKLSVAGPDTVRVEENDEWCSYMGNWQQVTGFYSGGFGRRATKAGAKVKVFYSSNRTHDLYVGSTLYFGRARVDVSLNGDALTELNTNLGSDAEIYARRLLRSNVPAGQHNVEITLKEDGIFDFDFLEAAVPDDIPPPKPPRNHASPALDYSTDHTYKLSPARIHWAFDQLGLTGPMNEYIGVFWWNERRRTGAVFPEVEINFSGEWAAGDSAFINIGGISLGKSVFPNEGPAVIAKHFEGFINGTFVGVYAQASGGTLIIRSSAISPAYEFPISINKESVDGVMTKIGTLGGGNPGIWEVDPDATHALNRGARAWHLDFSKEAAARNRELTIACSMELVFAPVSFAAVFPDNQPVLTSVGFGSLISTHCTFNTPMRNYQKKAYTDIASLQHQAGLTPRVQFGEFLWWFFTNRTAQNPGGGMAFYDEETKQRALLALGRPLHVFRGPNDNPAVNDYADANFLRSVLRDHINDLRITVLAQFPNAKFELLFPYDVNHPVPAGIHQLGGALNRYANFAAEWSNPNTSGFDTMKMEALDFGAWSRDLNLAKTAIRFPIEQGWPVERVRYLVPVFRGGLAWEKEYLEARGIGIPVVNFWAWDHVCLFNLRVDEPQASRSAQTLG
jgi:hypothetical protein